GSRNAARSSLPFFFQAEDGIRDRNVTGVQTCALPICGSRLFLLGSFPWVLLHSAAGAFAPPAVLWLLISSPSARASVCSASFKRSEERRVGKEGSAG